MQFTVNSVMVDDEEDEDEVFEVASDLIRNGFYTQMDYEVNEDSTREVEIQERAEHEYELRKDEQ